jgi:hypothetical protein
MPLTRYQKLAKAAKAAAEKQQAARRPYNAQLSVYRHYDFGLRRGAEPRVMALWQLRFIMKTEVEQLPRRYALFVSSDGQLVGYVQHSVLTVNHTRQQVETLSVLQPQHFDELSEDSLTELLTELHQWIGRLGVVA